MSAPNGSWTEYIQSLQNVEAYREQHWEGGFDEYIEMVRKDPRIIRNAHQRLYDMICSYGTEEYTEYKKKITHFEFFNDPFNEGEDAVYGLDLPLMKLVNVFKSAAYGYGN